MRQPIIAGNWKMHLGRVDEALAFVRRIRYQLNGIEGVDRVLCPPFTVLASVAEAIRPTRIGLGAQTMHWEEQGAHTGEISPMALAGLCQYVILGHSERRAANNESDDSVNRKVHAALAHDLTPIICVGEDLAQNEAGQTHEFIGGQVRAALAGLTVEQAAQCIIAYEPLWAIGTGKAATPADANRVIGLTIRGAIAETFGEATAQAVRVQYGGSVNAENIAAFMTMPEVDGALVGGASLKLDFVELVQRAASV
ncbi:MAG: triose-phosphate isomerase [Anaerolineaceae bacterium 4572_32.2]|nr:MAG: triose-phosphate isomerase [Anaerolineaceae bacterium 4572_32.2]HEY73816.1 triose-phosphate isomerase [Thermoflexia bacterium]